MINISSRLIDICETSRPNEKIDKIIRVTIDHIAPLENDMYISLKQEIKPLS